MSSFLHGSDLRPAEGSSPEPRCWCCPCCWWASTCWTTPLVSSSGLLCWESRGACRSCSLEPIKPHVSRRYPELWVERKEYEEIHFLFFHFEKNKWNTGFCFNAWKLLGEIKIKVVAQINIFPCKKSKSQIFHSVHHIDLVTFCAHHMSALLNLIEKSCFTTVSTTVAHHHSPFHTWHMCDNTLQFLSFTENCLWFL